jgi:hypothetical protein
MRRPLSFYLRAHGFWGFQRDADAVSWRHEVGVDRLIWGSGFGGRTRSVSNSRWVIETSFADVPDNERYRMVAGNVIEFFHLEDEVIEPEPPAAAVA